MSSVTVENTNPSWGVTRIFGKRYSAGPTRGGVSEIDGQRAEVRYVFDYDNFPPFHDKASTANVRLYPGEIVTGLTVEVEKAFAGGTSLQINLLANDGTQLAAAAPIGISSLNIANKIYGVNLGAGLVAPTDKEYHVVEVVATGTFTAGRARLHLRVERTANSSSKVAYNQG